MLGLQYAGLAINNWRQNSPEMYRRLKKAGTLNLRAQQKSQLAAEQVAKLMEQGMPQHQAEELVLPETVLAPPSLEARLGIEEDE